MAAQSPLPEDGENGEDRPGDAQEEAARSGNLLWHSAGLVRVTALDLAVLAGHVLLYPTGILPERAPADRADSAAHGPWDATTAPADSGRTAADPRAPGAPGAPEHCDAGSPPRTARPAPASTTPRNAHAPRTMPPRTATPNTPTPNPAPEGAAAVHAPTGRPENHPEIHPEGPAGSDPDEQHPEHRPVLLIHGFVDNRSAFTFLRRSLQHHGWDCVQSVNYSPLTSDIRTAAAQLGPSIDRIRARTGHDAVDIVAHSLGGLIARHYVQCQGGDAAVRTLVTLGTPHAGTRAVPALTPHPLARQMRPGSAVLRELAEPAAGCRTRFVAFWSDLDQLMIPATAARLEHPDLTVTNIQVSGVGHLALPVHSAVVAQVRRELAADAPGDGAIDVA